MCWSTNCINILNFFFTLSIFGDVIILFSVSFPWALALWCQFEIAHVDHFRDVIVSSMPAYMWVYVKKRDIQLIFNWISIKWKLSNFAGYCESFFLQVYLSTKSSSSFNSQFKAHNMFKCLSSFRFFSASFSVFVCVSKLKLKLNESVLEPKLPKKQRISWTFSLSPVFLCCVYFLCCWWRYP